MDISLTGAECVLAPGSGEGDADMMYVVGGRVNETAKEWEYPGLMHYSFKEKKWDWQRSESWVTKERTNHAAIYLPGAKRILVYSGSSDPHRSMRIRPPFDGCFKNLNCSSSKTTIVPNSASARASRGTSFHSEHLTRRYASSVFPLTKKSNCGTDSR